MERIARADVWPLMSLALAGDRSVVSAELICLCASAMDEAEFAALVRRLRESDLLGFPARPDVADEIESARRARGEGGLPDALLFHRDEIMSLFEAVIEAMLLRPDAPDTLERLLAGHREWLNERQRGRLAEGIRRRIKAIRFEPLTLRWSRIADSLVPAPVAWSSPRTSDLRSALRARR